MFIHRSKKKVKDKIYQSTLLMHNYRSKGKVLHKTIMNLSKWSAKEVDALDRILKGQRGLTHQDIDIVQGKSIGAIWALKKIANELGISKILGEGRHAKIMLLLIVARIITQGSRRHALHWADTQEIGVVFGLKDLKKDELYNALDELDKRQHEIEAGLFMHRYAEDAPSMYLYDVTSSYLEGSQNECGNWGYNRDRKKGTQQIVIGLLMAEDGIPIAIEVFEGNTSDTKTVANQINALKERFLVTNVTLVGDKGMIKGPQIEALSEEGIRYITSITKSQIRSLIQEDTIQLSLFDDKLVEVADKDIRYILRRNPVRKDEMSQSRDNKIRLIQSCIDKENKLMKEKPRRKGDTSLSIIDKKIDSFKLSKIVSIENSDDRSFKLTIDEIEKTKVAELDGCYVLKTNVIVANKSTELIHKAYKKLAVVESAFRSIKTTCLEIRPIYVRKESRTKGHVFLTMLSFMITSAFNNKTSTIDTLNLEEKIDVLDHIQTITISLFDKTIIKIPDLTHMAKNILEQLDVSMPSEAFLNKLRA